MGGNVTVINKKNAVETKAEKIKIYEIGRSDFIKKYLKIFKTLNKEFTKQYGYPIWKDESILENGFAFNGSTSYIMDNRLSNDEVMKYKSDAGDIDITVPEEIKADFWAYLDSIEGIEILPSVTYMGSNKPTISSIGEQINSIFRVHFDNGYVVNSQVDFEFLEFKNNKPTEWSKFSHSSAFEDTKAGIKAVNHKYLIRALVGGGSLNKDITVVTPSSKPDKLRFKKTNEVPRMLKFSIVRGIRQAYEPMFDANNEAIIIDDKPVYREIDPKKSEYVTNVKDIFKLSFQRKRAYKSDLKSFESFIGIVELMKKYFNKEQIDETHARYIELLWGTKERAQELEANNADLDWFIKSCGYRYFIDNLGLEDKSNQYINDYYKNYGQRKSRNFRLFLNETEGK